MEFIAETSQVYQLNLSKRTTLDMIAHAYFDTRELLNGNITARHSHFPPPYARRIGGSTAAY